MDLRFSSSLPGRASSVRLARALCREALGHSGLRPATVDEVVLSLSEACGHVLRQPGPTAGLEVEVAVDGGQCRVAVRGSGGSAAVDLPGDCGQLVVLRALVNELELERGDDGARVTFVKRLPSRPHLRVLGRV